VQVNSLGLTEQQPENNVYRILIEMLAVTLSKKARARAVQLPAWNEALGLPRPWDQQWSMRMQQIMAFETDLLEYGDLFDGNPVVDAKVEELKEGARAELANLDAMGGAIAGDRLHEGPAGRSECRPRQRDRARRDGRGRREQVHPVRAVAPDGRGWRIMVVDPAWRRTRSRGSGLARIRDEDAVQRRAGRPCARLPRKGATSCPPPSRRRRPARPPANGPGEMRRAHGEYRGPTGVSKAVSNKTEGLDDIRAAVDAVSDSLGRRLKFLVGKPGSTAIPTAPNRSRSARAIAGWISPMRASA
jgi:(2R)-ethylmalonyl-CoA mutase